MSAVRQEKEKPKPKQVTKPDPGEIIQQRYELIRALGEGGFGAVFEVMDIKTKERYAMKMELEKQPDDEPGLDLEGAVLRRLQGYMHILRYVSEGEWGASKHLFLIMELAGPSLASLRKSVKHHRFTNSTMARLGAQSLSAIEIVHVSGLLHRDIKPANFAIGHAGDARRTVYILDFGLVRKHLLPNGQVRPARRSAGFRGSIQFASVMCHINKDLGRCDDIWCWLYMMVQMRSGKLPWREYSGKEKVGLIKQRTQKSELMAKMEPEFHAIYDSLETLEYADEPPYADYHVLLCKIMERKNIKLEHPFDWEKPERLETKDKKVKTKKAQKNPPKSVKDEKSKERSEREKPKAEKGENNNEKEDSNDQQPEKPKQNEKVEKSQIQGQKSATVEEDGTKGRSKRKKSEKNEKSDQKEASQQKRDANEKNSEVQKKEKEKETLEKRENEKQAEERKKKEENEVDLLIKGKQEKLPAQKDEKAT